MSVRTRCGTTRRYTCCRRSPAARLDVTNVWTAVACVLMPLLAQNLSAQVQEPPSALSVASDLVEAFNQHDPEAMARLVSADFEMYYVSETGVAERATTGRDQLIADMTIYFAARPSVRSVISGAVDGPVRVAFREQIVGGASSLAVYEVHDGLIRRVWYFPAEPSVGIAAKPR